MGCSGGGGGGEPVHRMVGTFTAVATMMKTYHHGYSFVEILTMVGDWNSNSYDNSLGQIWPWEEIGRNTALTTRNKHKHGSMGTNTALTTLWNECIQGNRWGEIPL